MSDIIVKLGGAEKKLVFNNRALMELERLSGESVYYLVQDPAKMMSVSFVARAIYCGLLYSKNSKLTLNKVLDDIDLAEVKDYFYAIMEGIPRALGVSDDDIEKAKKEMEDDDSPPDLETPGTGGSLE